MTRRIDDILADLVSAAKADEKGKATKAANASAGKTGLKKAPRRQLPSRVDPRSKTMFVILDRDLLCIKLRKGGSAAAIHLEELGKDGEEMVRRWMLTGQVVIGGRHARSGFSDALAEIVKREGATVTGFDPRQGVFGAERWTLETVLPRAQ